MPSELPPPVPRPPGGLPVEDEDDLLFAQPPPRAAWRRWLIVGLAATAVLALGAVGLLLYAVGTAWQRQFGGMGSGLAPPTPLGRGPFARVTVVRTTADIQALGGGDVDGDGRGEAMVWAGKELAIRDRSGGLRNVFPCGLKEINRSGSPGAWMPAVPGGGVRRPQVGTLQGRPAIVVTDGEGESLVAFRADGGRALDLRVKGSHVRCLAVADLDGDGESELLAGRSSAVGLVCSNGSGKTRWKHGAPTDPAWVFAGDGDADGKLEVFVGYDTGAVHILNADGKRIGQWPHWIPASAAECGDLNGDRRADFLLGKRQNPTQVSGGPSAVGNPYATLGLGVDLAGVAVDGTELWTWPLNAAGYLLNVAHLAHADVDLDGKGEWIASAPDGTLRVYDLDGNELGVYALGEQVQALGVVAGAAGERPQVWASLGRRAVVLEWQ